MRIRAHPASSTTPTNGVGIVESLQRQWQIVRVGLVVMVRDAEGALHQPRECIGRGHEGSFPAPRALEQHQAPTGCRDGAPGGQRGHGVGDRPQHMTLDDRVERARGRRFRRAVHEFDPGATRHGLGSCTLEHALGQVDPGHVEPEVGGGERERARAGSDVEHARRGGGQRALEDAPPDGGLHGVGQRVAGGVVVDRSVRVPPQADAVLRLAHEFGLRTAPPQDDDDIPGRAGLHHRAPRTR